MIDMYRTALKQTIFYLSILTVALRFRKWFITLQFFPSLLKVQGEKVSYIYNELGDVKVCAQARYRYAGWLIYA